MYQGLLRLKDSAGYLTVPTENGGPCLCCFCVHLLSSAFANASGIGSAPWGEKVIVMVTSSESEIVSGNMEIGEHNWHHNQRNLALVYCAYYCMLVSDVRRGGMNENETYGTVVGPRARIGD